MYAFYFDAPNNSRIGKTNFSINYWSKDKTLGFNNQVVCSFGSTARLVKQLGDVRLVIHRELASLSEPGNQTQSVLALLF